MLTQAHFLSKTTRKIQIIVTTHPRPHAQRRVQPSPRAYPHGAVANSHPPPESNRPHEIRDLMRATMTNPGIPLSQSTHLSCTAGDDVVTKNFVVYSLLAPRTRHDRENNKRIPNLYNHRTTEVSPCPAPLRQTRRKIV